MKGYYFINTDVNNTRAHTTQIFNTTAFINDLVELTIVAPLYNQNVNLSLIKTRQGLSKLPPVILLSNFGIKSPGLKSFVFFNLVAIKFIFHQQSKKEVDFIFFVSKTVKILKNLIWALVYKPIIRIVREGKLIGETKLKFLKKVKEEVNKVEKGNDCGMLFDPPVDFTIGDVVESFRVI